MAEGEGDRVADRDGLLEGEGEADRVAARELLGGGEGEADWVAAGDEDTPDLRGDTVRVGEGEALPGTRDRVLEHVREAEGDRDTGVGEEDRVRDGVRGGVRDGDGLRDGLRVGDRDAYGHPVVRWLATLSRQFWANAVAPLALVSHAWGREVLK